MQPHQQRVVDEKNELSDRLEKLLGFIGTDFYNSIPKKQQELLVLQSKAMLDYNSILGQRIYLFEETV